MGNFKVAMAVCNQAEATRLCLSSLQDTAQGWIDDIIILDNGSTEDIRGIAEMNRAKYVRNERNEGLIGPYNQLIEAAGECEWLALIHNDIVIHEKDWVARVLDTVDEIEGELGRKTNVGIVGFAGSRGAGPIGERIGFASNLRDVAEFHGRREPDWMPAAILDGAVLICRSEMLRKVGGFDRAYKFHHLYDYDISMTSLSAGYRNIVVGVDFTHRGGITACQGDAQASFALVVAEDPELAAHLVKLRETNSGTTPEMAIMDYNIQVFRRKWCHSGMLPIYFDQDFRVSHDMEAIK